MSPGDLDVFFAASSFSSKLFINNGTTFVDAYTARMGAVDQEMFASAALDVDGACVRGLGGAPQLFGQRNLLLQPLPCSFSPPGLTIRMVSSCR